MSNFKKFAMASVAAGLAVTAANAADLPLAPVPIPVIQEFSGWYLRGDIGMTNQTVGSLTNYVAPGTSVGTKFLTFDSAPLFSLGGGYQLNNWLRMDVTGEYRGNAHFHGQQVGVFGPVSLPDDYNASKSEWLFLANAYVDLGTWWCVTPYHRRRHRHLAQLDFELHRYRRHPGRSRRREHPEHHLRRKRFEVEPRVGAVCGTGLQSRSRPVARTHLSLRQSRLCDHRPDQLLRRCHGRQRAAVLVRHHQFAGCDARVSVGTSVSRKCRWHRRSSAKAERAATVS